MRVVSFVHPTTPPPTTDPEFGSVNPGTLQNGRGHVEVSDSGEVHLIASERGTFHLRFSFGDTRSPKVQPQPPPFEVTGPWTVDFQKGRGAPDQVKLEKLESLSHNADAGVKYFSGTAVYSADVDLPAEYASGGRRVMLDLGKVTGTPCASQRQRARSRFALVRRLRRRCDRRDSHRREPSSDRRDGHVEKSALSATSSNRRICSGEPCRCTGEISPADAAAGGISRLAGQGSNRGRPADESHSRPTIFPPIQRWMIRD